MLLPLLLLGNLIDVFHFSGNSS